jgi:hypothetical protein
MLLHKSQSNSPRRKGVMKPAEKLTQVGFSFDSNPLICMGSEVCFSALSLPMVVDQV